MPIDYYFGTGILDIKSLTEYLHSDMYTQMCELCCEPLSMITVYKVNDDDFSPDRLCIVETVGQLINHPIQRLHQRRN
jgi:hypothetical protein